MRTPKPSKWWTHSRHIIQFDELAAIRKTLIGAWHLKLGSYTSNLIFHADGTVAHTTEKKTFKWVIDVEAG